MPRRPTVRERLLEQLRVINCVGTAEDKAEARQLTLLLCEADVDQQMAANFATEQTATPTEPPTSRG